MRKVETGRSEEEMIAYALEAPASILPFMTELLTDHHELGSGAEAIVEAIRSLELPDNTTVVDLACGKGAVAVEVARQLGYQVIGIELHKPFIEECRNAAQEAKVANLCTFEHGDVIKLAGGRDPADVAIFAAVGDTLGPFDATMAILREYVKPGGHIIFSDVYLKDGAHEKFPGFEYASSKSKTIELLCAHGDVLANFYELSDKDDTGKDNSNSIMERALKLAKKHPALKEDFLNFAETQAEANNFIANNLVDAIWVIQKKANAQTK